MNYATVKQTTAQKLTVGLLSFAVTLVVISATVIGMVTPDQPGNLAVATAPVVAPGV